MKKYTVKQGDTAEGIATKEYGVGSESGRITSSNDGVSDPSSLKPNSTLVIPDINNSASKKNPSFIEAKSKSEIAISIDGERFTLWPTATITMSMDKIGDTFELKAPWTPENTAFRSLFKPFGYQDVAIFLGGEKLITGTAVTIRTTAEANRQEMVVSGYSKPAILNDVTMPSNSFPLEFSNVNLQQIADILVKPFGLKVEFTAEIGAQFQNVTLAPDGKIYSFLISLAQQRGLIISSAIDGTLIFQKSSETKASSSIIEGREPFISASVSFNGQKRFSSYVALGDGWEEGEGQRVVVEDETMKNAGIIRPFIYRVKDISSGDLQNAAKAKLGRSIANSIEINVSVKDFRDKNGDLWRDNNRIIFQSDGNMLYTEDEYLIRSVSFVKTPEAEIANLVLVFPEAFSGEIRTEFPWD